MRTCRLSQTRSAAVEMDGVEGVTKQVPIGKHDGAPTFSFRVFTIAPGGHTPLHTHPAEHVNYVISGHGLLVDENETERPLRAGDFALVMPREKHQYRNASESEPFVMICAVPKEYE